MTGSTAHSPLVLAGHSKNGIQIIYKWPKIIKCIQEHQLAPFYISCDEISIPLEECPICCTEFSTPINRTKCCLQPICTGCLLQLKPPMIRFQQPDHSTADNLPTKCPFCANEHRFSTLYLEHPENARKVVQEYKKKRKQSIWKRLTTPNIYAGIELDSLRRISCSPANY